MTIAKDNIPSFRRKINGLDWETTITEELVKDKAFEVRKTKVFKKVVEDVLFVKFECGHKRQAASVRNYKNKKSMDCYHCEAEWMEANNITRAQMTAIKFA